MISETDLWKNELKKTASKLIVRMRQKKWSKRSVFNLEKELFLGFFIVRKLIESNKVLKDVERRKIDVLYFTRKSSKKDSFEVEHASQKKVSIRKISNQFIHSYKLVPFRTNEVLIGFLVTSEFESEKGVYLVTMFDIYDIYQACSEISE